MNSIKESNNLLKSHKFFTGVGSGFRLKNERIIFETIQLSFTYHPNSYTGVDDFRFNLEIEYKLNFNLMSKASKLQIFSQVSQLRHMLFFYLKYKNNSHWLKHLSLIANL